MNTFQNRTEKISTLTRSVARTLALSLLLAVCLVSVAVVQTEACKCEFSTKEYEAYGTGGACGIFMSNDDKTCEISFAGTGANANIIISQLNKSAWKKQFEFAPLIFDQYLKYIQKKEKGYFLDSGFIKESMVVMARAALFRESSMKTKLPLKTIDSLFEEFSEKNSTQIAATFKGGDSFRVEIATVNDKPIKGVVFTVGQGYIEMNFQDKAKVLVLYFSKHQR